MSLIKPTLFGHHKYLSLSERIGLEALHYLGRLWCHCENEQRGDTWNVPDPAAYVEQVSTWRGQPGELYRVLVQLHWIDELPDGGICIHGWSEANRNILHAWNARRNSRKTPEKPPSKSADSQGMVRGLSPDSQGNIRRPSPDSQGMVRGPSGDDPLPSVNFSSSVLQDQGTSLSQGGAGGKKNAPLGRHKTKSPGATASRPPSAGELRSAYAATVALIKELEADQEEAGGLSADQMRELAKLREQKRAIQQQQAEAHHQHTK